MSKSVNESIFSSESVVIPMADVLFIEKDKRKGFEENIIVIFKGTTWNQEIDNWNNNAYLQGNEAKSFLKAWCYYRHELEIDTLVDN